MKDIVFYYKSTDDNKHNTIGRTLRQLDPTKEHRITIEEIKPIRSLGQNRYYFGIVLKIISMASGEDDIDKLHKDYCMRFNPEYINYPNGERHTIPGETKGMDKSEFAQFTNRVKADARMHFPRINFPEVGDATTQLWEEIDRQHKESYYGV